jgi:phosphoribosylformimino-5-aminoimidazole carboxamide ribotide isomerase
VTEFECIPAIDLKGGKCVRLQEGAADRATQYGDDPVAIAEYWEAQGAARLHLVDLDGAFSGDPAHRAVALRVFRTLRIPVQFGGGLRSIDHISYILENGADRVILGTVAAENPDLVEQVCRRWPGRIVAGLDARGGKIALRGWVDQTATDAVALARLLKNHGVDRVIYTDVARDGMLRGVNLDETEALARQAGVRVIASGGVSSSDDVRALWSRRDSGIEGVILGRALYEKRIDLAALLGEVREWNAGRNGT